MGLLTPSVNVPAERAKLRALRDAIAADVAAQQEHDRKFTSRGYFRRFVPDVPELATQAVGRHGAAQVRTVRPRADLALPATTARVQQAQAGGAGQISAACGVGAGKGAGGVAAALTERMKQQTEKTTT